MAAVLKTAMARKRHRGFESHALRRPTVLLEPVEAAFLRCRSSALAGRAAAEVLAVGVRVAKVRGLALLAERTDRIGFRPFPRTFVVTDVRRPEELQVETVPPRHASLRGRTLLASLHGVRLLLCSGSNRCAAPPRTTPAAIRTFPA